MAVVMATTVASANCIDSAHNKTVAASKAVRAGIGNTIIKFAVLC